MGIRFVNTTAIELLFVHILFGYTVHIVVVRYIVVVEATTTTGMA